VRGPTQQLSPELPGIAPAAVCLALLIVPWLSWPACAEETDPAAPARGEPVRGITVSTHTDGRDWADDPMVPTLQEIKSVGANWVTIHPYAGIRADGSLRFRPIDPDHPPQHVVRPIREAHALGLKILIKPHLAYWGSPFAWRGAIAFETAEQWERFWTDYERWITGLARVSAHADAFVVGTELDRTVGHEARWRRVIAGVRERSGAPLTYAANWDSFHEVPFWDALDAVGIQAYFPLTGADEAISESSIRAGWQRWMQQLARFSAEQQRPIVFTELGYNRSHAAPLRPWDDRTDGDDARAVQEVCLREALLAIDGEPSVVGAFLWKWFPRPHSIGRTFQLATPQLKRVIRDAWFER